MKKKKSKRGGKRKGAGRKGNFNEKSRVLSVRVPESRHDEIKAIVQDLITDF